MSFQEKYLKWYLIKRSRYFAEWQELMNWYVGLRTTPRLEEKKL
jgi:hypothetical protein